MAASSSSLRSFLVMLLVFTIVLAPVVVLQCNSARVGREILQRRPLCPACVCCEPPPPGSCCRCGCPGGPGQVQNNSP